jgi:putative tricarboxylic transport membrane protein
MATAMDGHPMARRGQAFEAISLAAKSSAFGGVISALTLMVFAPPLADIALAFGPPEVFWVAVFGIVSTSVLIGEDALKGIIAASVGLLLGLVGLDPVTGAERFTFGLVELTGGVPLVVVMIALFAMPAVLVLAETGGTRGIDASKTELHREKRERTSLSSLLPVWLRSSGMGIFIGVLPGLGGAISGLMAYGFQKRGSNDPDSYGKGNPLGLAAAETANNADNSAAMIPTLTLGVPGSGAAAVIMAGLLIHGLEPGPQLFTDNPDIVFGFMWSMLFTAAGLVLFCNRHVLRIFIATLRVPPPALVPMIVALGVIGSYAYASSMFNVWLMVVLAGVGYAAYRLSFPPAPVILALFLGPKIEYNLRISLMLDGGDAAILWTRPICIVLIILTVAIVAWPLLAKRLRAFRRRSVSTNP